MKLKLPSIDYILLLLSISYNFGCATVIKDEQFCSPIPNADGRIDQNSLTACDQMLTSNPELLTPQQWSDLQASWIAQKQAVECFSSNALADFKSEIEELCSQAKCSYEVQKKAIQAVSKIQALGHSSKRVERP